MELLTFLVIGLVAGLVTSKVLKSGGHGLVIDTIIGAFGAYAGTALFTLMGITASGSIAPLAVATVGAFALYAMVKVLPTK